MVAVVIRNGTVSTPCLVFSWLSDCGQSVRFQQQRADIPSSALRLLPVKVGFHPSSFEILTAREFGVKTDLRVLVRKFYFQFNFFFPALNVENDGFPGFVRLKNPIQHRTTLRFVLVDLQ